MRFHIERFEPGRVIGWAFSDSGGDVQIEVWNGAEKIANGVADTSRSDVGATFAENPGAGNSGFSIEYPLPRSDNMKKIRISVRIVGDGVEEILEDVIIVGRPALTLVGAFLPLPGPIASLLHQLYGPKILGESDVALVNRLVLSFERADHPTRAVILPYFRFLDACKHHFEFVERNFPARNSDSAQGRKDFSSKQVSCSEMLGIANHLYVLKSYGATGKFAEFGCFKGYSSSMLSYGCSLLSIPMEIFDSFEGLPASDSKYYQAGDFAGSLDEVKNNISLFGSPHMVTYHKGFFSETLSRADLGDLCCLWMDVDLLQSAQDVMKAFPLLDPRGAVFSHECRPENFMGGISAADHSDSVIPPILAAFNKAGAEISGRFVGGYTGAFWREDVGIPVLSIEGLQILLAAAGRH